MEFEKIQAPQTIEIKAKNATLDETANAQPRLLDDEMQDKQPMQAVQDEALLAQNEPLVQQNLTENAALVTLAHEQHPAIPVTHTAQSTPEQQLPPAKKSWKQKKTDASHLKEVRKKTRSHDQQGDLTSYAMRQNLIQKQKNDAKKKLVPDYKKDYSSESLEVKNAFLNSFTKEMLGVRLDNDMLTDEYMEKHTADLKELYDRIAAFRSLKDDAANDDFFNSLPDADTQLLRTRMHQLITFSDLLATRFACKCVHLDGQYNTPEEQRQALSEVAEREQEFLSATQLYEAKKQEVEAAEVPDPLYVKPEEMFTFENTIKLSREDAIFSYSDQLSRQKRDQLNDILALCSAEIKQEPHMKAVVTAVEDYIKGDRYTAGYTEERELLLTVLQKLENAINADLQNELSVAVLYRLQTYFNEMTNGTLQIPQDAEILDYHETEPKETGSVSHGGKRNALIRKFSYWSNQKDTPLFSHEPTVNDLKQRLVSNCYMVAGTAGLVNLSPEILKSCIKDNLDGTVTVRLYQKKYRQDEAPVDPQASAEASEIKETLQPTGDLDIDAFLEEADTMDQQLQETAAREATAYYEPVYIKVSKRIPRVAGADALSAGALWMQMIEKACAFLGRNGATGYKSLWYGEGGNFLERLLGIAPEQQNMAAKDTLFQEICSARKNNKIFNTGTENDVASADGLNAGHAYTIMGGKLINGKPYVLLRNPYSTMSLEYQEDGSKTRTGHMLDTHSDETYGQFYMEYEEFLAKFRSVSCTDLNKASNNTEI